jgi:hypothetical protein
MHVYQGHEGDAVTDSSAKIDYSIYTAVSQSIKFPKNDNNTIQLKHLNENTIKSSLNIRRKPVLNISINMSLPLPTSVSTLSTDDKDDDDDVKIQQKEKSNVSLLLPKPQLEVISNNNSTEKLSQKSRHVEIIPQKNEENSKKSEVLEVNLNEELEKVQHLEIMKDVNTPIKNKPIPLLIQKIDPITDNSSSKFDTKLGDIPPVLYTNNIIQPLVKLDSHDVLPSSPKFDQKIVPPIQESSPKFGTNSGDHILISAPRDHEDFVPPSIKTDTLTGLYTCIYVLLYMIIYFHIYVYIFIY